MSDRTCKVDDCDNPGRVRRWCIKHYRRWARHGDPTVTLVAPNGAPHEWLDAHLAAPPTDDCVEWPYADNGSGYGRIAVNGEARYVTHIVLERTGRPRPPSPRDNALHSCHNPPCCNPRHLRWGTDAENTADMVEAGRATRGESSGSSMLSRPEVEAIRSRYAAGGVTQQALADEHGVSRSTIAMILTGRRWAHLV